jgi:hypothetical protein
MSDETDALLQAMEKLQNRIDQLVVIQRRAEVATLTSALLGSRRKSLSINELLSISNDILHARYPHQQSAEYIEWEKTKDERLNYIYK